MEYTSNLDRERERHLAALAKIERRLDAYESMPHESELPEDAVLFFTKSYRAGYNPYTRDEKAVRYQYAAVRASDGFWYVTGKTGAQGAMSYGRLLEFILARGILHELWLATEWQQLA